MALDIWYDDTAPTSPTTPSNAGEAVVLLHPGIHDSTIWDGVLPLLGEYRVIRFDRRGFGRSPIATEEFTTWLDLAALLDELELDRVHLVGNSMGGGTAQSLALERPDRVASLTLLAPAIQGYPWEEPTDPDRIAFEERWNGEYEAAKEAGDAEAMGLLLGELFCAAGIDEDVRAQLTASSQADLEQDRLEQDDPEHWVRAGALEIPVTVVVGELDEADSTVAGIALAERIPGAERVLVAEADHLIPLRAPELVAEVVRRTIARTQQGRPQSPG